MTLRSLSEGADARQKVEWERTSWLLAKLHNVNCGRRSDMVSPNDLNPTYRGPRRGRGQQVDADYNRAMCEALEAAERKQEK